MHKTLYSILLNYFILFQLVLQKEPSVLNVIIFRRIHKKVVQLIKLIVLENDSEFHANWNIDPNSVLKSGFNIHDT